MDLLVYLKEKTSRSDYVFNHIFHHICGLNISYTDDVECFLESNLPKINYSKKSFSNEIFFYASDILFEKDIKKQDLTCSNYDGIVVFFLCDKGVLNFDPFAATFYMLSRYEEYLPYNKDQVGRFPPEESILFKMNTLELPVVDHWIIFIKNILLKTYPSLVFKTHKFNFVNTIDIDNAYAYLGKSFFRLLASSFRDLIRLNCNNVKERIQVLLFNKHDPYDQYDYLLNTHKKYNLNTIFFFLLGDFSHYDRNLNFSSSRLNTLIKKIYGFCNVGIHTSVGSVKCPSKVSIEKKRLIHIINQNVTINRQHFICLNIPYVYRTLIDSGIKHDYSMGFPSSPGFRAGTSYNFYFFDLLKNNATFLLLHPFSIMDVSLRNYLCLNQQQAIIQIKKIIDHIKIVNGTFISVWHNESLMDTGKWLNWRSVYDKMLKYIINE